MDGAGKLKEPRERSLPPSPRASSRASTPNTTHTGHNQPTTPKSTSSSPSQLREPMRTSVHPAHRHHHSQCGKGSVPSRPSSRLSRTSNQEPSTPSATSGAAYFHELLDRERKVQSEKGIRQTSMGWDPSTPDARDGLHSPAFRSSSVLSERILKSKAGDDIMSSMGLKQMGEKYSTMQNQNFDLKVELDQRREAQRRLEKKVARLEKERTEMQELQHKLNNKIEKRDEAIAEALKTVTHLEALVDKLKRDREMAEGLFRVSTHQSDSTATETPGLDALDFPYSIDDAKSLARMPSFMREPNEETKNLREIVLENSTRTLHARKISEASAGHSDVNHLTSPSLSDLSMSSFVSIYGNKQQQEQDPAEWQPLEEMTGMDGCLIDRSATPKGWNDHQGSTAENDNARSFLKGGAAFYGQTLPGSLDDILEASPPMQRTEGVSSPSLRKGASLAEKRNFKREAPKHVNTSYWPNRSQIASPTALPPTPDTISSAVLHKHNNYTNSQDSLMRHDEGVEADESTSQPSSRSGHTRLSLGVRDASQPASISAFTGRRDRGHPPTVNPDLFSRVSPIKSTFSGRPLSDAETITAHARDSFISDSGSDSDGGAGCDDEWMREADRGHNAAPPDITDARGLTASPDLFTFPGSPDGWRTDVMFGALRGHGFLGSPNPALKRDPIDEAAAALSASQGTHIDILEARAMGPSPPHPSRTSSLQAAGTKPLGKLPRPGAAARRRNSLETATQPQRQPPPSLRSERTTQYPPISGAGRHHHRGLGLNALFRRSMGGSGASEPLPSPGRQTVPPPLSTRWAPPKAFSDDHDLHSSATPPPIMRDRERASSAMSMRDRERASSAMETRDRERAPSAMGNIAASVLGGRGSKGGVVSKGKAHRQGKSVSISAPLMPSRGDGSRERDSLASTRKWLGRGLGRMGSMKTR
ncbi:hypothetical protein F4780DRAFT_237743 [Xylariomycetidae sp. FL0641]|nr:hypothetical protein F4780DRAFT_237743 [Xylariomycetidae sp. FL0641]